MSAGWGRGRNGPALTLMALLGLAVAVALAPEPAVSQVCVGVPTGPGGWSVRVLGGMADHDGTHLGTRLTWQLTNHLTVGAGYGWTGFEGEGPDRHDGSVGVALEATPQVRRLYAGLPQALSLCPTAEVQMSDMGDLSVVAVRLGPAVGYTIEPGGHDWALYPFVSPLLVLRRASFEGLTDTTWNGGLRGGLRIAKGRILGGLELERVWTTSREDRALLSFGFLF